MAKRIAFVAPIYKRAEVKFVVEGPVVPLARPRVILRTKGSARAYTPDRSIAYKRTIAWGARKGLGRRPWPKDQYYSVFVTVFRPESKLGDIDNIAKIVLDGLTGTLYADDRQVRGLSVTMVATDFEQLSVFVYTLERTTV